MLLSTTPTFSYLDNQNATFDWINIPENSILNEKTYPYNGIGCSTYFNNDVYFITSSNPIKYTYNQQYCGRTKRYVEILKYNLNLNNFTDSLLIGDTTSSYPRAVGGMGNDNIVKCGVDKSLNMLLLLSSNIHNCPSNYNYDSSIVRVNLTDFTFFDRHLMKDMENKPTFAKHSFYNYKYLNLPTTFQHVNNYLWVTFGTRYTGIWKLKMTESNIVLTDFFQKTYEKFDEEGSLMIGQDRYYDTTFMDIKFSFINEKQTLIYFVEDTGYSNAQVMIFNYTNPVINDNNTVIKTLDGINYISDIKFDDVSEKIYIISGSLSSEMYQYDLNFNKLKISEGCSIDFVKFPTEWGVITNMQIDYNTGFIYYPISSRWGNNGMGTISQKDSKINDISALFGENFAINNNQNYFRWYNNINISTLVLDKGLLFVSSNYHSYYRKMAVINLKGCSLGRGINGNTCSKCDFGKFSNEIGGNCKKCNLGFSTNILESYECSECLSGKFSNGENAINCVDCPNGFYSKNTGSESCEACNKGTYSTSVGSSTKDSCLQCEDGKISLSGSKRCDFCPAGKWAKYGLECVLCSEGRYSYTSGLYSAKQCKFCPIGTYGDEEGLTLSLMCKNCNDGYIGIISGATSNTSCTICEHGKYKKSNTKCEDCDDGYVSNYGQNTCQKCPIGKVSDEYKITCIDCPMGQYGDAPGLYLLKRCKRCEVGRYSNKTGIISLDECIKCSFGKYNLNYGMISENDCKLCLTGKFKNNIMNLECSLCERGKYSLSGASECILCTKGYYADNIDDLSSLCNACPQGKYLDIDGGYLINSCKDCPAGRWNNLIVSISEDECIHCGIGKYSENVGATDINTCIDCPAGRFNKNNASISILECNICNEGSISFYGAFKCNICPQGKYAFTSENDLPSCESCPQGKYLDVDEGYLIDSCKDCPAGRWNNIIASISEDECISCLKGKYSESTAAISSDTCINCLAGKYNNDIGGNSINYCKPCSTGSMSLEGAEKCLNCIKGKYTELMGSTKCKFCEQGKIAPEEASLACATCPSMSEENVEKTACFCVSNTYNSEPNSTSCMSCPDNFICDKGSIISTLNIKSHYWRESKNTLDIYKCKNIHACRGGKILNSTDDLCQPGHKGPICDVCEKGWSKDDGVCLKCPEEIGRTISLTILIPVMCIFIIIFLIKTANPSNNKKEEVNGVVKIFMNYAQVFSLASSFQINWPTLIRYFFERAKEFSSPRVSFYSSDCAIGWSYYDKFIVYLALPLVYILISTFIIFIVSLCYCKKKKQMLKNMTQSQQQLLKKTSPSCMEFFIAWEKTAVVVGTFLSWPTIVEKTLEIMNCEKIGGKYYLVKDVSVECYNGQHYTYLILGYIGLILYGVGIPLLGFRLLYKYRFRLFDMQNRYDGSTPLSFLFLGYREKRWYYEFIIMGKKAGLILLSVFLRNYPRYQIIGASLLIQISFFIHVFLRPYDIITSYGMICNKLESVSLLSLVMTLSTGLFFGTVDSGYNLGLFEDVLIVLLLLANGTICLYFFVYFVTLTFKSVKNHLREYIVEKFTDTYTPCIFRCCSVEKIQKIRDWGDLEMVDDYGIHLKNQVEKEIFTNYFKEKQNKLVVLNEKIDSIKKRRVSVKLDKLRSQIQVMEKERCWQTIQNNRLYSELKKVAMLHKSSLGEDEDELKKLDDVFKLYIEHGIDYNEKINGLYTQELHGMLSKEKLDYLLKENIVISVSTNMSNQVDDNENYTIII